MFKETQPSQPESQEEKYREETEVNGINIIASYDTGYQDYVLYFPQIPVGEESSEKGVHDQLFRIDNNPENAKKVFDYAVKEAKNESDIYELYKKAEKFARSLDNVN